MCYAGSNLTPPSGLNTAAHARSSLWGEGETWALGSNGLLEEPGEEVGVLKEEAEAAAQEGLQVRVMEGD
jgi:hypothetical protein